ncbi:hypothetical protein [Blastococcus goldschmidtiae]|uniref:Lipoprotein n=1 Tax=Blastococcus goldschmidtiae TaxID=3075546 RepID=A0ABU2KDQ4_9ACTN|nr:hypothetical protein [Blastococcus sp. DSM 46792]MDT0278308.1 hypothetical protein [Blastococcus sp. DSM 46792]
MRIAGAVRLGMSAVVLAAASACVSSEDPRPPVDAAGALPAYEAPGGTPAFCHRLASLEELGRLPVSIGTLAAGTDVEARTQVTSAARELLAVLSDVRTEGGHDGLATALEGLVGALGEVGNGPLTDPVRGAVTAGLAQVGTQAQPACGFPT